MAAATQIHWHQLPISDADKVDGLRILLRPLIQTDIGLISVSASEDERRNITLQSEHGSGSGSTVPVIGFLQTKDSAKVSLDVALKNAAAFHFQFYYDPNSDGVAFENASGSEIQMLCLDGDESKSLRMGGRTTTMIGYGLWCLVLQSTRILEWTVLPRQSLKIQPPSEPVEASKRVQRQGLAKDTANSGLEPTAALVDLQRKRRGTSMTALIPGETLYLPGVKGEKGYQLTMRQTIMSKSSVEVFVAEHSELGECIVVKGLKIQEGSSAKYGDRLRHQTNAWLGEYIIHNKMRHESIVQLKGCDARYLALYLERIPCNDLTVKNHWRDDNHYFTGDLGDVQRIVVDVSAAIEYIHSRDVKHNDIKPGNILYSKDRGAVLCDFGVSESVTSHVMDFAGTPWYLPPELNDFQNRGIAGDVWALGITMLYLLRFTPLPDAALRAWRIADLLSNDTQARRVTQDRHREWVKTVTDLCSKLSRNEPLGDLVIAMLAEQPTSRITAKELLEAAKQLVSSNFSAAASPEGPHESAETQSTGDGKTQPLSPWAYDKGA